MRKIPSSKEAIPVRGGGGCITQYGTAPLAPHSLPEGIWGIKSVTRSRPFQLLSLAQRMIEFDPNDSAIRRHDVDLL